VPSVTDKTEPMCLVQQMTNRGWLPFAPTARRPLSHLIQLGGDVAKRKAGIGNGDRRYELHQMVFRSSARRPGEEFLFGELFADHAMDGATKALNGPVVAATIENPHDIVPAVLRPELPHRWQPCLRGRNELVEIEFLACFRNRLDCLRPPLSQAGISGKLSSRLCRLDACFGSLCDQRSFELGNSTKDLKGKHALRGRGIDRITNGSEMDAALLKVLDHLQEMADGPGQPIKADHDEDVASSELSEQSG